ncbi:hypothetical protein LUX39_16765 [Actinomadura madurae]|nr:hypothetical protein [Actinomadura madurae]MCQ0015173.1 hypothetical protein [Actinomadura madurae]
MRVEGRAPRPRPGGLHQTWGSVYSSAGGVHGPWPLRLVSRTKCVSARELSGTPARSASEQPAAPVFWRKRRHLDSRVPYETNSPVER